MSIESKGRALREVVLEQLSTTDSRAYEMWLPPLTDPTPANELIERDERQPLRFALGIMDEPRQHRQATWGVDVSGAGGNIGIGGAPQTGKSTLLQTMMLTAAATHSPRQIQFYCIDLGGGGLIYLDNLPHVGGGGRDPVGARPGHARSSGSASRSAATGNDLQGEPGRFDRGV